MISFKKINLGNAHIRLKPLFESGFIGIGDNLFKFEQALADFVGAKYVVSLNSCTSALFLSLLWEKKQGVEKVSIPDMTVPLVANAVLQAGLELELNDNVDWVGGRYRIVGTKIYDSAHELRRGCFIGLEDDAKLCFSFYPTKTIGTSDGGAIATNDEEFAEWARSMSVYGRNQKPFRQNYWEYDVNSLGYKFHWNDVQAVIALEQLERLDETNKKRQEIVAIYNNALDLNNTSDYLYRIEVGDKPKFFEYMQKYEIECGEHFKPLHLFKPFKDLPVYNKEEIEVAYKKTVSLPLYDSLLRRDAHRIAEVVHNYEPYLRPADTDDL